LANSILASCFETDKKETMNFSSYIKKIKTISLITIISATAFAQQPGGPQMPSIGVLTGRVLDNITNNPVEYANITLIRSRDTTAVSGGISNSEGYFDLRDLPLGRFEVRVEFMGYESLAIEDVRLSPRKSVEKHLGDIFLDPATLEGSSVEVTGERSLMTLTIDKRIFNVEKSLTSEGHSAIAPYWNKFLLLRLIMLRSLQTPLLNTIRTACQELSMWFSSRTA
jgi:hypothetical protein